MAEKDARRDRFLTCNGAAIRSLRLARGWTQDEFASVAGYSRRLVQKAESGGSLAPGTLQVLAQALSVDHTPVQVADLVATPLSVVQELIAIIEQHLSDTGPAAAHLIADDFVMWCAGDPSEIPFAGQWRGVEGLTNYFRTFFSILEPDPDGVVRDLRFLTSGPVVSCWGTAHARVAGMPESPPVWINFRFEVHEGKITSFNNLFDTQTGAEHLAEARARELLNQDWQLQGDGDAR